MKIDADIEGFMRRMDARKQKVRDAIEHATKAMADYTLEQVPPVPPASRKPYPFSSLRQWFWVIKSIQDGTLQVPYRRTNTTARKITTSVKPMGSDFVGAIGTDVIWAPWVISSEEFHGRGPQSEYHKGTWWTLQEVVRKSIKEARNIYNSIVGKALD